MPSIFPLEIEETILNFLAEEDEGHSALKTCSLVCQAFLHICRKHIFRSIVLGSSTTHRAFERLLRETPEIADYIRRFDYNVRTTDLSSPFIEDSLKRISKLEFLVIWHHYWRTFDWSNNPIRPALLRLLHLPTLTRFEVSNIDNFVVSDLIPCVNLKYLYIGIYTTLAAENTYPAAFPENSIRERIRGRYSRLHHEALHSSTSWWTADHRFWVSVQDKGGSPTARWLQGFTRVVQALSCPYRGTHIL